MSVNELYFPAVTHQMLIQYSQITKPETQSSHKKKKRALGLSYLIDENPPWYICLLLGFQVRRVIAAFATAYEAKTVAS